MGYDIFVFETRSAAEKFLCAVCQGVAKDVFETDCGHIFCRECVGKLIRITATSGNDKAQCPHCRAIVTWDNVHGSRFLNREISQLQSKCNLCDVWIGDLCKLSSHQLTECPDQFVDCVWKKYGCKEAKIKRKDVNKHNQQFKVSHLELKINCLQSQHQTQIQTLKRKYEEKINQLSQEKIYIEKKWKQKLILVHKKYGVSTPDNNNNININHIGHINISTTTATATATATATPTATDVQYHSDGSISFDPRNNNNNIQNVHTPVIASSNRTRRKRKRSVLDEFSTANDLNNNNNHLSANNSHNNTTKTKRVKKRRKMENNGGNNGSGSLLNALLTNRNRNSNNNANVTVRRTATGGRSASNRKKKGNNNKTEAPKKKRTRRRISNDEDSDNDSGESFESASDSDENMN